MYQVIKRDGRRVDFDLARIANAITKAFDAAKIPYNTAIIDLLALQVTADYAGKVRNNEIGVEDIQDSVEAVLQRAGYAAVAKSYILYRKNREKLREMHSTVLGSARPSVFSQAKNCCISFAVSLFSGMPPIPGLMYSRM